MAPPETRRTALAHGDPALLDDERITLVGLLFEAQAAVSRALLPTIEAHGLSPQSFEALLRLSRSPERRLRMSELAGTMASITPSGLTRLVDRLEASGLVERAQCPSDRRGSFAVLTSSGLDVVLAVLPAHIDDIERGYSGLFTERQRSQLEGLLRIVRDAHLD